MKLLSSRFAPLVVLGSLLLLGCEQGSATRTGPMTPQQSAEYEVPLDEVVDTKDFASTPLGKHGRLRVEGVDLVDEAGEPVQLRGVSSHWLNWENTGYATSKVVLMYMRDNWNVSLIRAAMGVGDNRGVAVSGGYLTAPDRMRKQVERIVENATELGVYVMIDWHDHVAFDHFDEASEFFREMAEQYKDHDNVFFEVFNEPIPGIRDAGRNFTWEGDIKPYHTAIVDVIREVNSHAVVILGTPFWSQGVDEAAADPVSGDNLMYTLHFYACEHTGWLRDRAQAAREAGLPIFVTEWGATTPSGGVPPETQVCAEEGSLWHDWMNTHSISSAAWKLDDCSDTSCFFAPNTPLTADLGTQLQGHGSFVVEKLLEPAAAQGSVTPPGGAVLADAAVPEDAAAPGTTAGAEGTAQPLPQAASGDAGDGGS
jgi:endoglucanase